MGISITSEPAMAMIPALVGFTNGQHEIDELGIDRMKNTKRNYAGPEKGNPHCTGNDTYTNNYKEKGYEDNNHLNKSYDNHPQNAKKFGEEIFRFLACIRTTCLFSDSLLHLHTRLLFFFPGSTH